MPTETWRLIHETLRSTFLRLPPNNLFVALDEEGISDEVDEETALVTATVPGFAIFSTPSTVPGQESGIPAAPSAPDQDPAAPSQASPGDETVEEKKRGARTGRR